MADLIEITQGGHTIRAEIPTEWSQMSPCQALSVIALHHRGVKAEELRTSAFFALLPPGGRRLIGKAYRKARRRASRRGDTESLLDLLSQVGRASSSLTYLTSVGGLYQNPVPILRRRFHTYRGPSEALQDITYLQYVYAERLMSEFSTLTQAGKSAAATHKVDELIGLLWIRTGRDPTPGVDLCARARIFSGLDPLKKTAILLYIAGSFQQIARRFPRIFSTEKSENSDGWGHAGVILHLSGDKFGHPRDVESTPLYTILIYLDLKAAQASKQNNNA